MAALWRCDHGATGRADIWGKVDATGLARVIQLEATIESNRSQAAEALANGNAEAAATATKLADNLQKAADAARAQAGQTRDGAGLRATVGIGFLLLIRLATGFAANTLYPHELSGGMLQLAMIALALAARPRVLIADEPTTALDATVQAQILALIRQIQKEDGIAVILITHDIGAVSVLADRVAVLYAGQVAEEGSAIDVLTTPVHPYKRGLLASVPDFRSDSASGTKEIPGIPPNQAQLEAGCRFADRCDRVQPQCRTRRPRLQTVGTGAVPHHVACPVVIAAEGIVTYD